MSEYTLKIEETKMIDGDPQVIFRVMNNGQEAFRRDARVFSEDDMIAASNDIAKIGFSNKADIDQIIAGVIEPIRIKWLRERETGSQQGQPDQSADQQAAVLPRYEAVVPGGNGSEAAGTSSIRDVANNRVLSNFILIFDEDIAVLDDIENERAFKGTLMIGAQTVPFRISADDYADNGKLKAAIFKAGGPTVQISCSMDVLRTAVSAISDQNGALRRREISTNFGWDSQSTLGAVEPTAPTAYIVPSGRITASGMEGVDDNVGLRVDLGDEEQARYLDMRPLNAEEVMRLKRHLVADLLPLHDRRVTHSMLAATACSILQPFAPGAGRFALWMTGLTGTGKSFLAKLFMNFFGDFPVSSGRFTTWSSTPNYIQRQGYYYKDALYLVDDFKPEVIQNYNVVRILQTYADGTARGRLKSDSTTNVSRPIRGLLVCTGEDVPEHSASSMARSLVIKVPQRAKDLVRGNRCVMESKNYSGITADFIRWLIAGDRFRIFGERYLELQERFYSDVAGQQNDIRIATNLALIGAAFEQFAEYLGDIWPDWQTEAQRFIAEDLFAIRGDMLGEVKDQQASEVFLRTLGGLIEFGRVRIDGITIKQADHAPLIGQTPLSRGASSPVLSSGAQADRIEMSMGLALAEVNKLLREQGRSELKATEQTLFRQLREDGKLLGSDGNPITNPSSNPTYRVRMATGSQRRVFAVSRRELFGE